LQFLNEGFRILPCYWPHAELITDLRSAAGRERYMDDLAIIADDELARLKSLANELLAAETVELPLLEGIALLAGDIAARRRDSARRRLLAAITEAATALFAPAADDATSRLADRPLDELANLEQLLSAALAAHHAFAETDRALMAAHDGGDFAAMAPLALEADRQKSALAAALAQFASRSGIDASLRTDPLKTPATAPTAARSAADAAAIDEPATPDADAAMSAPAGAISLTAEPPVSPPDGHPEAERQPATPERRRIRDLIRQVRPVADEAA
jgi:hypothetical protein